MLELHGAAQDLTWHSSKARLSGMWKSGSPGKRTDLLANELGSGVQVSYQKRSTVVTDDVLS